MTIISPQPIFLMWKKYSSYKLSRIFALPHLTFTYLKVTNVPTNAVLPIEIGNELSIITDVMVGIVKMLCNSD